MKVIKESHVDHGLNQSQLDFLVEKFAGKDAFFIETVELPEELGTVPCGLHGPLMDDSPVLEAEMVVRGDRPNPSRLCDRAARPTSKVTVIAGPNGDDACVLYTAFGGPLAPKEPGDPTLEGKALEESTAFWAVHALSR